MAAYIKRETLSQNLLFCDEELSKHTYVIGNGGLTGFSVADKVSYLYAIQMQLGYYFYQKSVFNDFIFLSTIH